MAHLGRIRTVGLAALLSIFGVIAFSVAATAQSGDPAAIQQKLNAQFKLTRTTADGTDIVTAGDVVEIRKPGLVMFAGTAVPSTNNYKAGIIGQGFGTALIMDNPNTMQRQFVPGEKCWVTGIQVQKDGVLFQLFSDPYNDVRYRGNLKIDFPIKKEVPAGDAAMQLVAEVLTNASADDQSNRSGQPPQGIQPEEIAGEYFLKETGSHLLLSADGSFTLSAGNGRQSPGQFTVDGDKLTLTYSATGRSSSFKIQGDNILTTTGLGWTRVKHAPESAPGAPPAAAAAPAPMEKIALPPPPADAAPATIALGQSRDEVIAAFGQPGRIAKLGAKEILYYKDMKVTLTDGKVSNVE